MYATWEFEGLVPVGQQEALGDVVGRLSGQTCIYVDQVNEAVLHATFDVQADDYDAALSAALNALRSTAAEEGLLGHLREVVAMTEEGQLRWAPPHDGPSAAHA